MCMTLHLDGYNFICQCLDQSNIAVKQDCKYMTGILSVNTVYNLVSSANNLIVTPTGARVQMRLTYNMNNIGPRTLPCGTPIMTGKMDEYDLSTLTLIGARFLTTDLVHRGGGKNLPQAYLEFYVAQKQSSNCTIIHII